jgi:hypothetical protein
MWDNGKYCKTFKTHASGLPECLFSSGYSRLETYITMLASYNDDAVNWAFSFKAKDKDFVNSEKGDTIVHISVTSVMNNIPVTVENMSSFFQNMKLRYNDGNRTKDIVIFLGVDFIDGMQLKCNVGPSDDSTTLIDPKTLNFIENHNIAIIPQTSEEYCRNAAHLNPLDLEHILKPNTLSPLQEEMLSYHYCLHHEPFPKMITLAENGEIPKCLASLKGRHPICISCLFGNAHKRSWHSKSKESHPIRKKSDNYPGECTSMDHFVSDQPGLIP